MRSLVYSSVYPCNGQDLRQKWPLTLARYVPRMVAMYIEAVPNRSSPPAILLRESYRQDG